MRSGGRQLRGYREVPDAGCNRIVEIGQVELLIGAVDVVVGQSKTHENRGNPEYFLKSSNHRDRTTRTQENRQRSKTFLVGERCCPHGGMIAVNQSRL